MKLPRPHLSTQTWLWLALVALLVAGYFAFHALFVKVSRSVEQPFSGPARHNGYYVLQRYLEERGLRVRTVRTWPQALSRGDLVLWFADDEVPRELRAWLAAGGELWSAYDPDGDPDADWEPTPWPGEEPAGSDQPARSGDPSADEPEEEREWCADGCLRAAQFRYGAGRLTLVTPGALTNYVVHRGATPARIDALLSGREPPAAVWIVTSVGSPWFGQLLLEHAPEALCALAVLLVLALWRAGTHFGPKLPARARERRHILEHVTAVGTLASRTGLAPLLAAARRELRQHLHKRLPHDASLREDPLVAAIAAATGLPAREVRRALLDEPAAAQDVLAIAHSVQALWRKT